MDRRGARCVVMEGAQYVTRILLAWYARNQRALPWRHVGEEPSGEPYGVWVSEVMLQQTQVRTVIPYFLRFMDRFPSVEALAQSDSVAILKQWQGLGYYHRAHNLQRAARAIVAAGEWPRTPKSWAVLPGVGAYVAAAICAITWDYPVLPIDANIRRVLTRFFGLACQPQATALAEAKSVAARWPDAVGPIRWGELAQAFMDFGSAICTPKAPRCSDCPLSSQCARYPDAAIVQKKQGGTPKPMRYGIALCLYNAAGALYLEPEEDGRLLHGLMRVPWQIQDTPTAPGEHCVTHVFSHFALQMHVVRACTETFSPEHPRLEWQPGMPPQAKRLFPLTFHGTWCSPEEISQLPLSALARKITHTSKPIR